MIDNICELFSCKKYDEVIMVGETHIDSSIINNYYVLVSLLIKDEIYRALSFINRSKIIKDNLDILEEGGANFKKLADLSNSQETFSLSLLLFISNFINSVFKESLLNNESGSKYYFIRINEMIDELYISGASSDMIDELTHCGEMLLDENAK